MFEFDDLDEIYKAIRHGAWGESIRMFQPNNQEFYGFGRWEIYISGVDTATI
jgi:hypothetical protein